MQLRTSLALALSLAAIPCAGWAHPHVFVDTKLRVVIGDDGTFEGLEVSWTYDDFYSLLLLSDYGLDNDGDGELDDSELVRLKGFDLQWIDGFEGDSYATRAGSPVALGAPQDRGVSVSAGQITSTHFRPASGPADGLVIKAFDPTFYTAYTLVDAVAVDGPCKATQVPADLDAAYTLVEELLYVTPSSDLEEGYPEVGEAFADTVTLSCAG